MKIKSLITIIFTVLFFAGMAALTLSARAVHNAGLPKVKERKLSYEYFPFEYTGDDGNIYTGTKSAPAIETELLKYDIYEIYKAEKNGELRYFARPAAVEAGAENNGYTEVTGGLYFGTKFITDENGELYDGAEIILEDQRGF